MALRIRNVLLAVTALVLVAGAASAAEKHTTLFGIGKPDGLSAEFGLTNRLWPHYLKVYPKPIVFTVGVSPLSAWPYIHPSNKDTWAGGKPHTFTIRHTAAKVPARPLFFILGLADVHERPLVTVSFNGKSVPARRAPPGVSRGASDPRGWHKPSRMVFAVPKGAIRPGPNTITIHCETASWIIYDYVLLTTDRTPPKLATDADTILEDALAGPMAGATDIIFAARQRGKDGHWYANFGYYAENDQRLTYGNGGKLYRLNLRTGRLTTLLDDPQGGVRDPQVHYDGKKILFSYRKGGSLNYHLYEIGADGSDLRQLTRGPYDDIEPTYLPGGDILFVSGRCNRWVNCWLTKVAVLYRCKPDGSDIRMISSNNEPDNTPWPLPDGTVLYTRWEYVDRSQVHYHHLWIVNPDGTGQMVYFGNMHGGITMIDAKPIPGTSKIVASFSPGHGRNEHDGVVTIVDPGSGPDARPFARTVSRGSNFRDPYALSEDCILAVRGRELVLMNGRGATKTVFTLGEADRKAGLECHEPRPLMPRPRERVIPPRIEPQQPTGRLMLVDARIGRNAAGVKPGEIKRLLILETLPKPINFTGGMEPLSYGGTFTLERVLGTVPVEPDGSAYFEVPAMRSLIFVAIDSSDLAVKRMQSFVTVQPGETTGCVGCHENRTDRPVQVTGRAAFRKAPSRIRPIADVPDVLDFPRDIQPILDRHCTRCHGYEKTKAGGPRSGGAILAGDRGPMFSHSYFTLSARRQMGDGRNLPKSNYPPRAFGSAAAPLMKKILTGHNGVKLSDRETTTVRLWIDTGAAYPGTYAALGTGMVGGYAQNRLDRSDTAWPTMKALADVQKRRCGSCHTKRFKLPGSPSDNMGMPPWAVRYGDPRLRFSRHILYNLTRPEKSLLLLAPLAKGTGGFGICKKGKEAARVFADTSDADYQKLLAAVQDTARRLNEIKRFDMAGFQPRPAYLREMKRYGLLPKDQTDGVPVDYYALEQKYWRSFWHEPPAQ